MHVVNSQIMRLAFYNHQSLVELSGILADELVPFHFETDSGESVLAFDYDRCPDHVKWLVDEMMRWNDASLNVF